MRWKDHQNTEDWSKTVTVGTKKWVSEYLYEIGKDNEKYKVTIQEYNGGTLTGVEILNFLKNYDQIMDEVWELCVGAINNRANGGHTLHPLTIEEFYTVLKLHRDLFK